MTDRTWSHYINPTVKAIPPSGIRRFFDLAAEMEGVISLGVGEPDFVTPWHIREACIYSLHKAVPPIPATTGCWNSGRKLQNILVPRVFNITPDRKCW
ncbi:hypothetical protein N752_30750 [Desulforamulus aquiferis]|nr:hypothetical protein N752_30750 [Desulforamulus aquiferis]